MIRRFAVTAMAACVLAIGAGPAMASTTPRPVILGGGCTASPNGADITLEAKLVMTTIDTPEGNEPAILGQLLFVQYCKPRSGSLDMILQEKTKSGWFDATSAPRVNLPSPTRGFAMVAGPYLCTGTSFYWRMALLIHGVSSGGVPQQDTQYYTNVAAPGNTQQPGGKKFSCP